MLGHRVSDVRLAAIAQSLRKNSILVIVGDSPDNLVHTNHKLRLARRLNAQILVVKDVAHMLFAQDPVFYAKIILNHIDTLF